MAGSTGIHISKRPDFSERQLSFLDLLSLRNPILDERIIAGHNKALSYCDPKQPVNPFEFFPDGISTVTNITSHVPFDANQSLARDKLPRYLFTPASLTLP